jgi:hypothetical protein
MDSQKVPAWRKSSRSGVNGNCVEFTQSASAINVRDSKNPTGPTLLFAAREWRRFIHAAKGGLYDL